MYRIYRTCNSTVVSNLKKCFTLMELLAEGQFISRTYLKETCFDFQDRLHKADVCLI